MLQTLLVVSTGNRGVGLTSVSLGILRALQRRRLRVGFCKPIAQPANGHVGPERTTELARTITGVASPPPIDRDHAEELMSGGEDQLLLEEVVAKCYEAIADRELDVLVVEGLVPGEHTPWATTVDVGMAHALDARIVLVCSPDGRTPHVMAEQLATCARRYDDGMERILGVVLNRVPTGETRLQVPPAGHVTAFDVPAMPEKTARPLRDALRTEGLSTLGLVPFSPALAAPRVHELAQALDANLLAPITDDRRIHAFAVAAMTAQHAIERGMNPGTLLITPGDRDDIIMAASLATMHGVRLAGLLLTGGIRPSQHVLELCRPAFETGLPVLLVDSNTWERAHVVDGFTAVLTLN